LNPNAFKNLLKEDRLEHVYLFHVEEEYEYENLVDDIKKKYLPEGIADFNFDKLDGREKSLVEIVSIASTAPMMSERRVVIVKQAQSVADAGLDYFSGFLNSTDKGSLLIFVAKDKLPSTEWAKMLKKKNLVVTFEQLKENNLIGWTVNYLKKRGYEIKPEAAGVIVNQIGNNLTDITNQLDKITTRFNTDEIIDSESVYNLILRSRRHKYWELTDALGEKDLSRSILIMNHMIDDGEPAPLLLGLISNYFGKLKISRVLMDSGLGMDQMCDVVGQRWYRKKFYMQVQRFDKERLRVIISALRQADENIKTGFASPQNNLERLLYNICTDDADYPKSSFKE
jgi:DNA polymerase-3 subunit delta